MTTLDELARAHGIALSYSAPKGRVRVPAATKRRLLASLGIEASKRSEASAVSVDAPVMRTAGTARCFIPDWLEEGRAWGISLQLYELRSSRNWGIGDFADLEAVCRIAGRAGADFIGLNPLHAMFTAEPRKCSPFSPSNRSFLNPLYIAVDAVPGHGSEVVDTDRLARLRATDVVDYAGVAEVKLDILRRLFRRWRNGGGEGGWSASAFDAFCTNEGENLRRHALFEALSARMVAEGHGSGWKGWPAEYRDAGGAAVAEFAAANADDVSFHMWLQWIARLQLDAAQRTAREAGMRIGLYLDFAVGEAPDGSATWSNPHLVIADMSVGAPPDIFAEHGQNWGLAPLSPTGLAAGDFEHYRTLVSAAMRSAGALRIDHVMALWQLFFIPEGGTAADGAYVRYRIDRLVEVLAEESRTHRALVIGEDLGNVPRGFRTIMRNAAILSYRLLYFEQEEGVFRSPGDYARVALACLSTHDLPTLIGWWRGTDVALRQTHGLVDAETSRIHAEARRTERRNLLAAMVAAGTLRAEDASAEADGDYFEAIAVAAHRYVARSSSMLANARLADLVGEERATNLPGTVDSYPNWQLKLDVAVEDLADTSLFRAITAAMAAERPRLP
ncbi:4-alpha-glucanotransferase [Microbaculum marinum]|uniref:4-alpha-glucanotransferase n=1 Tax=Microbaculum marinum TaxID=1764581 RepID=A0AAW9RVA8_9HYPH